MDLEQAFKWWVAFFCLGWILFGVVSCSVWVKSCGVNFQSPIKLEASRDGR